MGNAGLVGYYDSDLAGDIDTRKSTTSVLFFLSNCLVSWQFLKQRVVALSVRNRTLTLIEREDDTRSWGNFLVYFSHSSTMPYPPRGWGYILIGC
jgi:hypothetical protein